jgi:ornithine carbamoyltransferase
MTIKEFKGKLKGLKLAFIGDGNNMANSLIVGCLKMGMKIAVASPKGYEPDQEILDFAKGNPDFLLTTDIYEAAKNADAVYTDVWSSMGMEAEIEERKHSKNTKLMIN